MLFFCPRRERIPNPPSPRDITNLKTTLSDLADFCSGSSQPILVTGGLSIALQIGGVYRNHHDVDLAVSKEQLPEFLKHAEAKGFRLVRSIASGHISSGCDMHVLKNTSLDEVTKSGARHLRLVSQRRHLFLQANRITDYFDIFVYSIQQDRIHLFQEGFSVPIEDFFPITCYDLGCGKALYSPNIRYLSLIKQKKDTPTNRLDLSVILGGTEKPKSMVLIKEMF